MASSSSPQHRPAPEYDVEALHQGAYSETQAATEKTSFPLPVVIFFIAVSFWAGAYLITIGSGEGGDAAGGETAAVELTPMQLGEKVYGRVCQACHQTNGQGLAGQYPPLVGAEWVTRGNARPIAIVLHGLMGPIEVKGNVYNNNMAGWGTSLSDEDVANVLTYVRGTWGNAAPPVTAEAVAAVRAQFVGRAQQWTAEELEQTFEIDEDAGGAAAGGDETASL